MTFIIFNRKSKPAHYSKTIFHLDELVFLKKNFHLLSARQLLQEINKNRVDKISLTVLRMKYAELNLKKAERPEFWLKREELFLVNNYRNMGNIEICQHLNTFKNKSREFSVKHIWKKMRLLNLHRSEKELALIKKKNIAAGMYSRNQHIVAAKKRYPEGKKVVRRDTAGNKYYYIKHEGKMVQYHRLVWEMTFGPIPAGYKIFFKDGDTLNCRIDNLICEKGHCHRRKHLIEIESTNDVFLQPDKPHKSFYYPIYSFNFRQSMRLE